MRAVVMRGTGGPEVLELAEKPFQLPSRFEVRVRVHASGLNRADLVQRRGAYPAPHGAPVDILGLEYAGVVDDVGDDVTHVKVGDQVMGIVGGGAYAEFVVTHERDVVRAPKNLSLVQAGAIPEVFMTAFDALFAQLGVLAGETVLVHAVGSGVGTAALQLARWAGVRVIGTSRSKHKLERAQALGLSAGVLTTGTDESWVEKVSAIAPRGVDAVLDLVGGNYVKPSLKALRERGRYIVVGMTNGTRTELDLQLLLRKRLHLIGSTLRTRSAEEKMHLARSFEARVVPAFESGALQPVVDTVFEPTDVRAAHVRMESNQTFGKLLLRWV